MLPEELAIRTGRRQLRRDVLLDRPGRRHHRRPRSDGGGRTACSAKSTGGFTYQDADLHAKSDFHVVDTLFSSLALVGQDPSFVTDDRFKVLVPPNFLAGLTANRPRLPQATPRPTRQGGAPESAQGVGGRRAAGAGGRTRRWWPRESPLHTGLRAGATASVQPAGPAGRHRQCGTDELRGPRTS